MTSHDDDTSDPPDAPGGESPRRFAGAPDAVPWPEDANAIDPDDDIYLGEEASLPPGDYGELDEPAPEETTAELQELERRVDAERTPAFPLDERRRIAMAFVWKRWRRLALRGRSDVVDEYGRDPRATARWEPMMEFLYSRWFRAETTGIEHIPDRGPALLVANHAGALPYDSAMVMHAVRRDHPRRRDVRPLIEDGVFHLPYLGPFINRLGGVRACPENAERLLAKGELIAVFPEGIKGMGKLWRDRYRLQRFGRGGFVKIALRTGAPIIPIAVVGAEESTPMLAKVSWFARNIGLPWVPITPTFPLLGPLGLLPLPSKWMIDIGEPIELDSDPAAADDRILVSRIADQVRTKIQEMVEELRTRRRSAFV